LSWGIFYYIQVSEGKIQKHVHIYTSFEPQTCLLAVREALAAAAFEFFHAEFFTVRIAWYANV
jgi:hypothetical protein